VPEVLVHPAPAAETVERLRALGIAARAVEDLTTLAGDVVLVRDGARVAAGFVERLQAAAPDATVATVAAIALPDGDPAVVAERALGLRPRTTTLSLDCTLVTAAALDAAGPLDQGFAERCAALGLLHVIADDVLVTGVPATDMSDPLDRFEYGDLPPRPATRLERALTWTRRVVEGLEVTLDVRMLRDVRSGTEVQALALIEALQRTGAVKLRLLLEEGVPVPEAVREFPVVTEAKGARRTAIVHRVSQVAGAEDLLRLAHVGERLVVSHLDLLLFHDPAYHASTDTWAGYRRMTASALAAADLVVAISAAAADDLRAEDLVPAERLRRVHLGTDHERPGEAVRPPGVGDGPFIVQLGSDLRHKQRPFAIALVAELRALGWPGGLVLAGPSVEHGSSREQEPEHDFVVKLGSVSDAERRWLYREAAAVAFPSTSEGFGLVPFEAANAGTLPLVAPVSALRELVGEENALLVPWDPKASAERVLPALTSPGAIVGAVRERGARLTWDATARQLLELYDEVLALPARAAAHSAFQALAAEARRGHWEGTYYDLRNQVGANGIELAQALPENAQRALLTAFSPEARRKLLSKVTRRAR